MRSSVWIYHEGFLSKNNTTPILEKLRLFTNINIVSKFKRSDELIYSVEDFKTKVRKNDVLVTGIGTPGRIEMELLIFCKKVKARTILIISDLGYEPIKLRFRNGSYLIPDLVILPDPISYELFHLRIGNFNSFRGGLPFLDSFIGETSGLKKYGNDQRTIGYFSLPIDSDKENWQWPIKFSNKSIQGHLFSLSEELNLPLYYRFHPKETGKSISSNFEKIIFESSRDLSISDFINAHKFFISTYSTSLILCASLNKKCCSFQPNSQFKIRSRLFEAIGIPIFEQSSEVKFFYDNDNPIDFNLNSHIFNYGSSIDPITKKILEFL